ncbi:DUF1775 domain-containing protein [Plantactinospora sp. BB1]|uniref:DUF1775 domain-containing protein n=1 Tax=Plantactinospora sp. BB1 TaxID=2071627 RepID=UPI000D1599E2|nr:DUF1775 domain-containing protein [Plantactinospora sp. BB1]AVT37022.1 hypothetical protein C6W10_11735 [Plantactinospora sp. BB1]
MNARRWTRTVGAAAAATVAYLALGAAPAAAHVEIAEAQPNGDGTTTLTFSFDHSCDNSPTTELVVALPDGVTATTTATPNRWSAAVADDRVTFTGPGLETAQVGLTTRIIARAGDTLHFPVLQRCADGGSYDWIDITADSEHPAPRLIATNAVLANPPDPTTAPTPAAAAGAAQQQGGGATLGQALAVLAAFVLAAAAAGFGLARRV